MCIRDSLKIYEDMNDGDALFLILELFSYENLYLGGWDGCMACLPFVAIFSKSFLFLNYLFNTRWTIISHLPLAWPPLLATGSGSSTSSTLRWRVRLQRRWKRIIYKCFTLLKLIVNQLEVILIFENHWIGLHLSLWFSITLLASIVEIIAPFEVSSDAKLPRLSIEIVL